MISRILFNQVVLLRKTHKGIYFLIIFICALFLSGAFHTAPSTLAKILYHNFADYDDFKKFPARHLTASSSPFIFKENHSTSHLFSKPFVAKGETTDLATLLEKTDSLAFLVIKNDSLVYEKYLNGHSRNSLSISFSLAKSFLSALIGCAIEDGYIQSLEQPITDFVPELKSQDNVDFTIKNLIQMTTGMDYVERQLINNPFGKHARLYYSPFLKEEILGLKFSERPGKKFRYKSGESALLGFVLRRALKEKNIAEYLQERIWSPVGMENNGVVNIDHDAPDGLEKMWCCIGATSRDLSKLGLLYLHNGSLQNKQIVPRKWVERSLKFETEEGSTPEYQLGWWLTEDDRNYFQAEGLFGQYIHVNPDTNTVIVRLGKSRGYLTREDWIDVLYYFSQRA